MLILKAPVFSQHQISSAQVRLPLFIVGNKNLGIFTSVDKLKNAFFCLKL